MQNLEELVFKAKNKDEHSFEQLILKIENDLYRIAQAKLDNIEDINDAIQETLIISFKSIKKLENSQYFKTWIIRILINECNKIYKKNNKSLSLLKKIKETKNVIDYDIQDINNVECKIELEKIFSFLSHEEKICLTLFYNSNFSISEISDILKISQNTIKSRITRAKNKIKKYYNGGVENETAKK